MSELISESSVISKPEFKAKQELNLDTIDKLIINTLQKGFPLCSSPFAEVARQLDITEEILIRRVQILLDQGILTRFGPMYDAAELGGGLTLAAMSVSDEDFEVVAEYLHGLKEVAHNYQRDHKLNMWFVIATECYEELADIIAEIEKNTEYRVYNMPKQHSFFINLYLSVE